MDEKLIRLAEIMQEANSLAGELALGCDIELSCNVTPKTFYIASERKPITAKKLRNYIDAVRRKYHEIYFSPEKSHS